MMFGCRIMTIRLLMVTILLWVSSGFNNPICTGRKYLCSDKNPTNVCVWVEDDKNKKYLLRKCNSN